MDGRDCRKNTAPIQSYEPSYSQRPVNHHSHNGTELNARIPIINDQNSSTEDDTIVSTTTTDKRSRRFTMSSAGAEPLTPVDVGIFAAEELEDDDAARRLEEQRLPHGENHKVDQTDDDTARSEGWGGWNSTLASLRDRPGFGQHLSHLSAMSTDTTEGDSSEGNTFSVDSDEMAFKFKRGSSASGSSANNSSTADDVGDAHVLEEARNDLVNSFRRPPPSIRSYSLSAMPTVLPVVSSPLAVLKSSNLFEDIAMPSERVSISRTSSDSTEGPDSTTRASRVSSEESGTVLGGSKSGEQTHGEDGGSTALGPMTESSVATDQTDEVHELRAEDRLDDWSENQDKKQHIGVYEHRKEINDSFQFRPRGGKSYDAQDPSYATYFGSKTSDVPTSKGKEREWLPADHFDAIEAEYKEATANFGNRDRIGDSVRSPNSMQSAEQDRARFEAAIRARHQNQTVRFEPQRNTDGEVAEILGRGDGLRGRRQSSFGANLPQSARRRSSQVPAQSPGLSRRPSNKRAHTNKMSWDLALLSPAPHNDEVEENEKDRDAKTRGSGRTPVGTPGSSADVNIIEQAFQAAIAANSTNLPGVVHLEIAADANLQPPTDRPPLSPGAETVSSRSSGASRHRFRSYHGPALPEIETPGSHADLFYLAFGNGGSSSRQSLTGKTVKKKRERAEEDKVERDRIAVEKAEKEERRKQPHDDNFERSVNDDSTTESQTESVTESAHTTSTISKSNMQESKEKAAELVEERRRNRRQAKKKERENGNSPSPEPIIPAAVIMPITGMTIFTKDGRPLVNDPKDPSIITIQRAEADEPPSHRSHTKRPSLSSGSKSETKIPKVRNAGSVLRPQGSFTTARRPNMTIDADAIRAKALASDDRFDTINLDQLQAAADAGDQIAEAHLRQRGRWKQMRGDQDTIVIPADLKGNGPPVRRRNTVGTASSRRRSSAEALPEISRKAGAPLMQSIPEDASTHPRSTLAERKVSRDIQNQVEQIESRRSSDSTNSSGRLSTTSLGSAVEALMETSGDPDNPFHLPIKLSSLSQRSGSSDQTKVGSGSQGYSKSQPSTPNDTMSSRRPSGFISNPMFSSNQDFFNMPAFPPVTSPSPLSPTGGPSGTPRKGSGRSSISGVATSSPNREPELFMDVARLTSMQVEKGRARDRAQDARNKGLATESSTTRAARKSNDRRLRVDEANNGLAEADAKAKAQDDSAIISAMSSFGISYESNRRPSVDNTVDPLQGDDGQEQRRAERQRKKRMLRQLEHERVIRETPMDEYSNPMDTYLGKARMSESRDAMPQLSESNDEDEDEIRAKTSTATDTGHIPSPCGMASGEG